MQQQDPLMTQLDVEEQRKKAVRAQVALLGLFFDLILGIKARKNTNPPTERRISCHISLCLHIV